MQPARKIASNYLLTHEGLIASPLVTCSADGRLLSVQLCENPDREPLTEFYAGVLVVGLDATAVIPLLTDHTTPITELLRPHIDAERQTLHLLSGLDYRQLRCTEQSRLQRL